MRREPYEFQKLVIDRGNPETGRNILLNDEVGCGKKVTCIEIAAAAYQHHSRPVLVVTVKRDILQWQTEIERQLGDETPPIVIGTVDIITVPNKTHFWLLLHYEALVRHVTALAKIKWAATILDEGHYIKNWVAQRSRAAKRLHADRKVVATGTPIDKSPADLWSPLEFLYPETYRKKKMAFEEKHVKSFIDASGHTRILPGAKDPAALAAELAPFTFSRTKAEVAPFLPPNIIKHVSIALEGQQENLYRRIATSTDLLVNVPELDDPLYIPTRLTQLLRLQQVTTDPELLESTAPSAKIEWLVNWREGNPNEPTLIFTCYRNTARKLARMLDAHLIIGGENLPSKWTKPTIVATIAAGAEALNLDWMTTGIFVDVTWRSLKMTQAIGRIHRLSNTSPVETIFLTMPNTVDDVMSKAIDKKWSEYELIRAYVEKFGRRPATDPRGTPTRV